MNPETTTDGREQKVRIINAIKNSLFIRRDLRANYQQVVFERLGWPSKPPRTVEVLATTCDLQDLPPRNSDELNLAAAADSYSPLAIKFKLKQDRFLICFQRTASGKAEELPISFHRSDYFQAENTARSYCGERDYFSSSFCQLLGALMAVEDESFLWVKERGILICSRQPLQTELALQCALLPGRFWETRSVPPKPLSHDDWRSEAYYPLDSRGIVDFSLAMQRAPLTAEDSPLLLITKPFFFDSA